MAYWMDWLNLLVRFIHVITAIAWIGASFYFVWLDNHLQTPPEWKQKKGIKGDLWAIHGGGFYEVAKYQLGPEAMPPHLHWFKWEAYSTWISGFTLLCLMYLAGGSYLLDPAKSSLTAFTGSLVVLGLLIGSWLAYDALCRSPLGRHGKWLAGALLALIALVAWILDSLFSGRAAFLITGACIGTCMAFNVWRVIMPAQTSLVHAVRFNKAPDPAPPLAAKLRSTHNNYATLPVVFLMISNHYPVIYGYRHGWLALVALVMLGMGVRHFFNLRHQGISRPRLLWGAAILFFLIAWLIKPVPVVRPAMTATATTATAQTATQSAITMPSTGADLSNGTSAAAGMAATSIASAAAIAAHNPVTSAMAMQIIQQRCSSCHAASPTDPQFSAPPLGFRLETEADVRQGAAKIRLNAVDSQVMPFANRTGMTDTERQQLGQWLTEQGL